MLASISHSFNSFGSLLTRSFAEAVKPKEEKTLFQRVNDIIEKDIRPFIQQDGGDIELHDIKNGCMIVSLEGACTHCGSKNSTLQYGVLGAVQDQIPEITNIRLKLPFDDFDMD